MPKPVAIEYIKSEHLLRVAFDHGQTYEYPTVYLRGYCPCALCQGHGSGPPKWVEVTHWLQASVENVTPVGNYALCIVWADGHDTGIYTFASLLEIATEKLGSLPPERTMPTQTHEV